MANPNPATALPPVTIFLAGDVLPGRGVAPRLRSGETNLATFKQPIEAADIAFCNLEAAFPATTLPPTKKTSPPRLWATPEGVRAIGDAGFDLASTANNHSLDGGPVGWKKLDFALKNIKVAQIGSRLGNAPWQPFQVTVHSQKLCFLAASNWGPFQEGEAQTRPIQNSGLIEQVRELNIQGNRVFVSLHWGIEHQTQPTSGQRQLAHHLIEAGAWAIIGHHSHTAGPVEVYRGRPIFYSLGNFVFDRMSRPQSGLVAILNVTDRAITFKTQVVRPDSATKPNVVFQPAAVINDKLPVPKNETLMASRAGHFLKGDAGRQTVVWSRVKNSLATTNDRDRLRLLRRESNGWRVLAYGAHPQIRDLQQGDVDGDGQEEIWLELQQRSKLDTVSRPRIHLYSAALKENGSYVFRARWRGSALSRPFIAWAVLPRSTKGSDLIALENNISPLSHGYSWVAVYRWNDFGFRRLWESPVRGTVSHLMVSRDAQGVFADFIQGNPNPRTIRLRSKASEGQDVFAAQVVSEVAGKK